jgi:hypothetical protein
MQEELEQIASELCDDNGGTKMTAVMCRVRAPVVQNSALTLSSIPITSLCLLRFSKHRALNNYFGSGERDRGKTSPPQKPE